jgi:hypothetical protein
MFGRKKEEKPKPPEISRFHRKCGCVVLVFNNGLFGDVFQMDLCEDHKSRIVDREVIEEKTSE